METRNNIKDETGFEEGQFPVRYSGVPLSSKKLSIQHYLPLINRIIRRNIHWSTRMLSYAGRIQLVKSIFCSIAQYWMQNFPLPKAVIKKIDALCRSFIWTGNAEVSRKFLVAWAKVCSPNDQAGIGLINMAVWNQVSLMKCLWNISSKSDNLWVKWIHTNHLKGKDILEAEVGNRWTGIIRKTLK